MLGKLPQIPDGSGADASFFRWAHESITATSRIGDAPGVRVNRTTRGTYIEAEPADDSVKSKDRRLFNFRNGSYFGTNLGPIDQFQDRDLGAQIPGWTAGVQDNIKSALESGRRIRIAVTLQTGTQKLDTGDPVSFAVVKLCFFCGTDKFFVVLNLNQAGTAESSDDYFSYSGEISQSAASGSVTLTEANATYGAFQTGASNGGSLVPYPSQIASGAPSAAFTAITDGKITGILDQSVNISGSVGLRAITIDSLPKVSGG